MGSPNRTSNGPESQGRTWTVSIAVPGSVIDNTQNVEYATFVAGQIARVAAIYNVDEVVVLDESCSENSDTVSSGAAFLARLLQFMETPQYLKKLLIPVHPDLRLAGLLPPLDAPHHLRATEWKPYREGVVLKSQEGVGSFVDIGLDRTAFVKQPLRPNLRVTLDVGQTMATQFMPELSENVVCAKVVSPSTPRERHGLYWGYSVRIARGIKSLFKEGPFSYDLKVGTSERGEAVGPCELLLPHFRHILIAFGGPLGLEHTFKGDPHYSTRTPVEVFDVYLNTCPHQGSRTIRTEEAIDRKSVV